MFREPLLKFLVLNVVFILLHFEHIHVQSLLHLVKAWVHPLPCHHLRLKLSLKLQELVLVEVVRKLSSGKHLLEELNVIIVHLIGVIAN